MDLELKEKVELFDIECWQKATSEGKVALFLLKLNHSSNLDEVFSLDGTATKLYEYLDAIHEEGFDDFAISCVHCEPMNVVNNTINIVLGILNSHGPHLVIGHESVRQLNFKHVNNQYKLV